jgi:hypothetical protein
LRRAFCSPLRRASRSPSRSRSRNMRRRSRSSSGTQPLEWILSQTSPSQNPPHFT